MGKHYLRPVYQDRHGVPGELRNGLGNCFPACVASVMGLGLEEIPHWYEQGGGDDQAAFWGFVDWVHGRGWGAVTFDWPTMPAYLHGQLAGAVVILRGLSPRPPHLGHAVVGQLDGHGGWRMVHDPNEAGGGIVGEPTNAALLYPMVHAAP